MNMLEFLAAVVLILVTVTAVILRKTYYFVPFRELKRQAEGGDDLARTLYRAVAYDGSLRTLLWLVIGLSAAGAFVLLAQVAPAWMGFLLIAILLWLTFSWLPGSRLSSPAARLAVTLTPVVVAVLNWTRPLLALAERVRQRYTPSHTGLFEKADFLALLDRQSRQPDSRITPEELDLVKHVLSFGDYKVRDTLRPRKLVKAVAAGDAIGPVLLDELHASGQTSFPVKKGPRSETIVGTLHLSDVGIHSTGTVKDHMHEGVTFVHEADSLADALHAFYQTKRQLFVAVNSFEEYVGVITLQDILHQLVGRPEPNETLGSHDDLAAVAARHTPKVTHIDEEIDLATEPEFAVEPAALDDEAVSESDESVVE